ncbi:MAG: hypothetical protein GKR94_30950 [Gammaproteobacteria bacterium]|nr:hypothetical protein [Gammaproteobacteria bacterium]
MQATHTAIRTTPIDEPSAWVADELAADDSWRHTLTAEETAELHQATLKAEERGLQVGEFDNDDFLLPTLGPRIEALVEGVENGRGVALLKGVPVERYSHNTRKLLYWGFGVYAGEVISQNSKGQLLAEVRDHGNDYGKQNTRGFSTNAQLLPHVDTSDMTTLLCVRTARRGGDSRVVSATNAYNALLREHPEHLPILHRGFFNDLRGEGPTGDINELTHDRIPVYSDFAGRVSCSYNARMIENAANKRGVPLTSDEQAALAKLREITLRPEYGFKFRMAAGDLQMVSNHSVFHSRTHFDDHGEPERRRCLFRLWVNIRNGRPLAANFADRYNTGPRGGVAVGDGARYVFE